MSIKSIPFLALSIIRGYPRNPFLVFQNFLEDVVTLFQGHFTKLSYKIRIDDQNLTSSSLQDLILI